MPDQTPDPVAASRRLLDPIIGRWITLGSTATFPDAPSMRVATSDIYEWAGNGAHVLHQAYGLAGDQPGGGTEIIRFDDATGLFSCHFFDNEGDLSVETLQIEGTAWTWTGKVRRCRATFNADATQLTAEHEATADDGVTWFPTATVTLHRAG